MRLKRIAAASDKPHDTPSYSSTTVTAVSYVVTKYGKNKSDSPSYSSTTVTAVSCVVTVKTIVIAPATVPLPARR